MSTGEKVKQQLERLGITVRASPRAWTIGIAFVALWAGTAHGPGKSADPLPYPLPRPQWETRIPDPHDRLPQVISAGLPEPDKRQRKAPCDPDIEKEINGYCWLPLRKGPPCPAGKAFEHEGACYLQAILPPRMPTTGGGVPLGIADPE